MRKVLEASIIVLTLVCLLVSAANAGQVMDRILKKGQLNVGITGTQPPLNMKDKNGRMMGLDANLAEMIAGNMNVTVNFITMPFSQLLPALESGKVDMVISSMTMTPKRNLKVAFVGPYYISGKGILTKYDKIAALQDPTGLNNPNFKVATLRDSTSQMFVERAAPKAKLLTTKEYKEAVSLLIDGKIDAVVADFPFCAFSALRHKSKGLIAGQAPLTFEPLGIAIPEDPLFINWMQNFLGVLDGTGQMKAMAQRWFQDGRWMKDLPAE